MADYTPRNELVCEKRVCGKVPTPTVPQELGPKFDIRTIHDEMLNGGVLPLDLLDARH